MSAALPLWSVGHWVEVRRCDRLAASLADRHYSRQTPGAVEFLPPGQTLALVTRYGGALWGVCLNLDPVGALRWRVTIFRREHGPLASDLVREATALTYSRWRERGPLPSVPLTTEVDPRKTRKKRDPGRCFLRAGWRVMDPDRNGLVVLCAPAASEAAPLPRAGAGVEGGARGSARGRRSVERLEAALAELDDDDDLSDIPF